MDPAVLDFAAPLSRGYPCTRPIVVMTPEVVADVIEGEAVIMNLKTGQYFNSEGTGASVGRPSPRGWPSPRSSINSQRSTQPIARRSHRPSRSFVEELISQQLIARIDTPPPESPRRRRIRRWRRFMLRCSTSTRTCRIFCFSIRSTTWTRRAGQQTRCRRRRAKPRPDMTLRTPEGIPASLHQRGLHRPRRGSLSRSGPRSVFASTYPVREVLVVDGGPRIARRKSPSEWAPASCLNDPPGSPPHTTRESRRPVGLRRLHLPRRSVASREAREAGGIPRRRIRRSRSASATYGMCSRGRPRLRGSARSCWIARFRA